jgi:plastocyanin
MAMSGLVFGLFAMAASMFAVALAAQAADEARNGTRAAGTDTASNQEASAGGHTAAEGDGPIAATVTVKEFRIEPAAITVPAGSAVRVENGGSIAHNLSIETRATPLLDHNKSADLQLGGLAAGSYTMRCTVPGHEAAGMKGTVTIQ